MVSLQTSLSRKIVPEFENLLKRRRLNGGDSHSDDHDQSSITTLDTELHLETPIPPEWQRCLDIKSGQIYFYNTRTNRKMLSDPRSSPEPPPAAAASPPPPLPHMCLDLELNLPCGSSSSTTSTAKNQDIKKPNTSSNDHHRIFKNSATTATAGGGGGPGLSRAPSWLSFEGEQEMVAAACKKCHMLVMMCKSSPSCPNCKFLHPQEQSSSGPLLKRRLLSLLC